MAHAECNLQNRFQLKEEKGKEKTEKDFLRASFL